MYKSDVIKHFGTRIALAQKLNISPSAITQWPDVIPEKQAYRIEKITKGVLKVNPSLYEQNL